MFRTAAQSLRFRAGVVAARHQVALQQRAMSTAATLPKQSPPSEKVVQLADQILALNLMEGKELSDLLKERLGIPKDAVMGFGAAPVAAAPAAAPVAPVAEKKEEAPAAKAKSSYDVKLEACPADKKIALIKSFRTLVTNMPLKEAKDLIESAPCVLGKGLSKDVAEQWKKTLEEAGAKIALV
eukprot:TRINITY_DN9261_c0_g1_i1.p1 TRINITY_DN9261_c0_g1~~TRINITY_DN9261_c0_g1_i1.p1  ORF type:complete len:183 (+),score=49.58 TRINITY_DN9261_c0_g1_i1:25-573(+)